MRSAPFFGPRIEPLEPRLLLAVVADYQDDFQGGSFPSSWQYLRNADNQPIGDPANYVGLQWSGTRWEANGDAAFPDPAPAAFTFLRGSGGHPGQGIGNGASVDHYAIAAYTISADGFYVISNSLIANIDSGASNGGEVRVYVNSSLVDGKTYADNGSTDFDTGLGILNAGDTIYVAVGPNGNHGSDSFALDFSIATAPPAAPAIPLASAVLSADERKAGVTAESGGRSAVAGLNRMDVDGDGLTSARDVLRVVNALGATSGSTLNATRRAALDVDGNGRVSAFDALLLINHLRKESMVPDRVRVWNDSGQVDSVMREFDEDELALIDEESLADQQLLASLNT